ncbi:MAG: radical SAM protein, partial [Candidatus Portnoybacteria bacterium]
MNTLSKKDKQLIELFRKITYLHYLTDYSSLDFIYPPHFIWDKFNKSHFNKIKKKFLPGSYSLYIHFPYCQSKCKFCRQFSLATKNKKLYQEYIDLLVRELEIYARATGIISLTEIYFGGGTPTLFPLGKLFKALSPYIHPDSIGQINVESTPESLNRQKLEMLKKVGIDRLLIGIQSLDQKVLKLINRSQKRSHFIKIYNLAKKIGIPVINLELVAGLPGQTLESFLKDLKDIIELKPESIHIYGYMNSPTTIFCRQRYQRTQEDLNLQEKMLLGGKRMLSKANYFFLKDEYCLNKKSSSRNLSLCRSGNPSGQRTLGQIALGMSAMGSFSLTDGDSLKTINTMDYKKYKKAVLGKEPSIEKVFLLNQDEKIRAALIKGYRYGKLDIEKEEFLKEPCNSAFSFLKRQG